MKCMAMEGSHLYRGFEPWNTAFEKGDRTEQNGLQGYIKHGLVLIAQSAKQVDLAAYCMALAYMRGDIGANFPHLCSIPSAHADQAKYWLVMALDTEIRHKIMSDHDRFEAEKELERVKKLQKKFEEEKQYVGEYRGEGVGTRWPARRAPRRASRCTRAGCRGRAPGTPLVGSQSAGAAPRSEASCGAATAPSHGSRSRVLRRHGSETP